MGSYQTPGRLLSPVFKITITFQIKTFSAALILYQPKIFSTHMINNLSSGFNMGFKMVRILYFAVYQKEFTKKG